MNVRTFAPALAGALIMALGACAGPDDGAEADGSDAQSVDAVAATRAIKVLHWNLSGAVLNRGFNNVADKLIAEFDARRPDVISINEGCRDQVEYVRDRLRAKGFTATLQFAPTGDNALCVRSFGTNTAQAGPAVIAVWGGVTGYNHYWKGTTSVDERTDRGMACISADFGKRVRFCSLHLATNDAEAAAQAESMLARFGQSFRDAPAVLLGDFNAGPGFLRQHAPNLYAPAGQFFEIDSARDLPTHGEGKLDYVFMSRDHFVDGGALEVKDMGRHDPWWGSERAFSDHRLMHGEITLKL